HPRPQRLRRGRQDRLRHLRQRVQLALVDPQLRRRLPPLHLLRQHRRHPRPRVLPEVASREAESNCAEPLEETLENKMSTAVDKKKTSPAILLIAVAISVFLTIATFGQELTSRPDRGMGGKGEYQTS